MDRARGLDGKEKLAVELWPRNQQRIDPDKTQSKMEE